MTPERARQLLGGLAAGILTPEERQTLLEAALHDQALFNEVADELEIAAFLQSPETRAQLANRIEVEPERRPWWPTPICRSGPPRRAALKSPSRVSPFRRWWRWKLRDVLAPII